MHKSAVGALVFGITSESLGLHGISESRGRIPRVISLLFSLPAICGSRQMNPPVLGCALIYFL